MSGRKRCRASCEDMGNGVALACREKAGHSGPHIGERRRGHTLVSATWYGPSNLTTPIGLGGAASVTRPTDG